MGDRGVRAGRTLGAGRAAAATTTTTAASLSGRRPIGDRAALAGIAFVLKTDIAWNQLPTGLVGCSGITCWRRLRDWTQAGVWPAVHELLLAELRAADRLDLDRCAVDGSHVRALTGGTRSAPRRSTARVLAPRII
jgi:transposase